MNTLLGSDLENIWTQKIRLEDKNETGYGITELCWTDTDVDASETGMLSPCCEWKCTSSAIVVWLEISIDS